MCNRPIPAEEQAACFEGTELALEHLFDDEYDEVTKLTDQHSQRPTSLGPYVGLVLTSPVSRVSPIWQDDEDEDYADEESESGSFGQWVTTLMEDLADLRPSDGEGEGEGEGEGDG